MLEVVYEDKDIIVVIKPSGMPCQKDPSGDPDVYSNVKTYLEGKSESVALGLVQRLDRPVGGLVVMSKSAKANKALTAMVTDRKIDKYYLALVDGTAEEQAHLEHWLQKVRGNRAIISRTKTSGSKSAILDYERLSVQEADGEAVSLLRVKLHTGRHHQIRAQLAFMKLPLLGDTKYNPKYQQKKGWFMIKLYAYQLRFKHPVTGDEMFFEKLPGGFGAYMNSIDSMIPKE